jgi:4-hydroxy-tetrahydrodipicolinate reductase
MIRVAVAGAAGRMGETVCRAVEGAPDMTLTGRADPALGVPIADVLPDADVLVDFTTPATVVANARAATAAGVHIVIGTTGFDVGEIVGDAAAGDAAAGDAAAGDAAAGDAAAGGASPAEATAPGNVFIAPNFAIGAVLMMRFAAEAAPLMAKAEIIELHHDRKLDAPSGTAARTATLMAQAAPDRPAVPIHSVRLPGLVAHQEVILGDLGQTLTIRHDSIDRESFMPGVLLAIRRVGDLPESPVVGLERLLF